MATSPSPAADSQAYGGWATPGSGAGEFNAQVFLIAQIVGRANTATLVVVKAVDTGAETVDVQPMVAQLDGQGQATAHGVVFGVPYFRLQGGANAVIMDPVVGDIGIAVFASRDISSVKATKAPANPGSLRRFDMADGLYLGGFLNGTPTQYVRFHAGGIELKPAAGQPVTVTGPLHVTGAVTGDTTAVFGGDVTGDGVSLSTHTHGGVQTGGGTTGPPT